MVGLRAAALIVVTFNSSSLLRANLVGSGLDSVASIIVVDNSTDADEARITREIAAAARWSFVATGANVGFGAAVNRGVDLALDQGAEVVILLNPDAILTPESAEDLIERASADRIVAPKILDEHGGIWFAGGHLDSDRGVVRHVNGARDWLTGACLAIDVRVWRKLGGFDEEYFLYWEDVDLSDRWKRLNGHLEVLDDVVAVHAVGGTQGVTRGKSRTYLYYNSRNRLLFALAGRGVGNGLKVLAYTPFYSWRLCRRANPSNTSEWFTALGTVFSGAVSGVRAASDRRRKLKAAHG